MNFLVGALLKNILGRGNKQSVLGEKKKDRDTNYLNDFDDFDDFDFKPKLGQYRRR